MTLVSSKIIIQNSLHEPELDSVRWAAKRNRTKMTDGLHRQRAESRHNLIKHLQSDLARGAPFDLATLGTPPGQPEGLCVSIAERAEPLGVQTRLIRSKDSSDTKLIVGNDTSRFKIEVNIVFRGTVLPVEHWPLSARTSDLFGVEFETPILARDELYAGKLVAALGRQHPRDAQPDSMQM